MTPAGQSQEYETRCCYHGTQFSVSEDFARRDIFELGVHAVVFQGEPQIEIQLRTWTMREWGTDKRLSAKLAGCHQ